VVGTPYTVAARLYTIAAGYWTEIDGEAALHGVELMHLPLDRFCNAIYAWAIQRVEDKERFDFELTRPVPGKVRDTDVEQELDDFASFMGAVRPT